jgi:methionine sulfoxide reductase heme-binding subunit
MTPPRKKTRLHWLQIITHIGVWIPLAWLIFDFYTNRLSVNPIQDMTQRTGDTAIILLILSLACTPLNTLFHFAPLNKVRTPLGLYAYMYVAFHLFIFVVIDYGFNFNFIIKDVGTKPYVLVGLSAFILLSLLALTSFRWWMVRLGKNWKRLHSLVYLINLLVVLHFAWASKGDLFRLQGNIVRPFLAGVLVLLLLTARIPQVRKRLSRLIRRPVPAGKARRAPGNLVETRTLSNKGPFEIEHHPGD